MGTYRPTLLSLADQLCSMRPGLLRSQLSLGLGLQQWRGTKGRGSNAGTAPASALGTAADGGPGHAARQPAVGQEAARQSRRQASSQAGAHLRHQQRFIKVGILAVLLQPPNGGLQVFAAAAIQRTSGTGSREALQAAATREGSSDCRRVPPGVARRVEAHNTRSGKAVPGKRPVTDWSAITQLLQSAAGTQQAACSIPPPSQPTLPLSLHPP